MLVAQAHYSDQEATKNLVDGFSSLLTGARDDHVFYCIGSDRHILDCFGPLVGTMLSSMVPGLKVFGTLDQPLHAKNLMQKIADIQSQYPGRLEIAVDASLGPVSDIGIIKLKDESLLPGKAIFKKLPPVGHYSVIGIVDSQVNRHRVSAVNSGSIKHVYHMANLVCRAIHEWYTGKGKF
ncbi:MAG: spore protease YyaC [Syntrophomonadaceae bacterium]|jgi:putative sporulation protein YyaC